MAENYGMLYCEQKWERLVQQFSSHLPSKFTVVVLVQRTDSGNAAQQEVKKNEQLARSANTVTRIVRGYLPLFRL
jgi:hypothetical protein